jgi:NTP pyrophosphatase (non-canonical NTP hydrolase)
MPKSLREMEAEVKAYQQEKGWTEYRSVPVSLALLHEEVSEVGRAWREWGLGDATTGVTADGPDHSRQAKPQGVGSELADVVIRIMDTSGRYGLGVPGLVPHHRGAFALSEEFMVNVNTLHDLISRVSLAWESNHSADTTADDLAAGLATVLAFTFQLARRSGINIQYEYERKMAYNHTRDYRHGNRRC